MEEIQAIMFERFCE